MKNSSQHVVQTILDAAGVVNGLKQFKYLDEKMKDHGINVSSAAAQTRMLSSAGRPVLGQRCWLEPDRWLSQQCVVVFYADGPERRCLVLMHA